MDNDLLSDRRPPHSLHRRHRKQAATPDLTTLLAAALLAAACDGDPEDSAAPPGASFLPEPPAPRIGCGEFGYLRGELFGALETRIDWSDTRLNCEGMPRPEGRGARLRFSGTADALPLALIVAIPALERAATGVELASNVTLIEEGSGRFFTTADLDTCWSDIEEQVAIDDGDPRHLVAGRLYCIAPLVQVNGSASVSIRELRFSGFLDWSGS